RSIVPLVEERAWAESRGSQPMPARPSALGVGPVKILLQVTIAVAVTIDTCVSSVPLAEAIARFELVRHAYAIGIRARFAALDVWISTCLGNRGDERACHVEYITKHAPVRRVDVGNPVS